MTVAYFNGEWMDVEQLRLWTTLQSSAAVIETMCMTGGTVKLLPYHFERCQKSCDLLHLPFPFNIKRWELLVFEIAEKNNLTNGRLRLQISANAFVLTWQPLDHPPFEGPEVEAVIVPQPLLLFTEISFIKSTSRLAYQFAQQFADSKKVATALLLNANNQVTESCNSNVFIVEGKTIVTPPLTSGCIAGVFRNFLLEKLGGSFEMLEAPISMERLLQADEVFLTNAVKGVQPVATIDHKSLFDKKITSEIKKAANHLLGFH